MVGVGPSPHGEFHPEAIRQMKAAGAWLKVNGEAIFATRSRPGILWSEGETVRYTRSKDRRFVYAILTEWPGTKVVFKAVRPKVGSKVALLGSDARLSWKLDGTQGTIVTLPENLHKPITDPVITPGL